LQLQPNCGIFRKIFIPMNANSVLRLNAWIENLQARGEWSFSLSQAKNELLNYSDVALKRAISRLSVKGNIVSIYKGYYLILPPQYAKAGVLPPELFIDAFFEFLDRPYYVSLLNAAALHGASHQQPQEFFITTGFPSMRPTHKNGMKINYISIGKFPGKLLEKRKTEAGYINISNPVLTATDMVQFEKRIGGINRAATVLVELSEILRPEDFDGEIIKQSPVTTLQRLGFILENACHDTELADALFTALQQNQMKLYRIPLKTSVKTEGYSSANRWKVIVNTIIETDI